MKTKILTSTAALIAASCLVVTPATAASAANAGGLPPMHEQGAISYLSGGIGQNEADAIKRVAKQYPLEIEFLLKAKAKDEYLANVKVLVKDMHDKKVLEATSNGPFLLAKMPAGKYDIAADRNGKIEHRTVQIAANEHRRIVFEWKA